MQEGVRVSGASTDFSPSDTIWGTCPWLAISTGQVNGHVFEDYFRSFDKTPATTEGNWAASNGYAQFSGTGGFINAPAIASGVAQNGITIGSDDDNEGVGLRTLSTPFVLSRDAFDFWFECRLKKSSIANTIAEIFIGLMENAALTATVPITATAATLADQNLVGFYSTESAGSKGSTTYKANGVTAVTVGTDEVTFVADTYTKLGMRYTKRGRSEGSWVLSFYQDGTRLAGYKSLPLAAGTDFPNDVAMGPVVAIRNAAGSSPGTMTLSWWKAAQLIAPLD